MCASLGDLIPCHFPASPAPQHGTSRPIIPTAHLTFKGVVSTPQPCSSWSLASTLESQATFQSSLLHKVIPATQQCLGKHCEKKKKNPDPHSKHHY